MRLKVHKLSDICRNIMQRNGINRHMIFSYWTIIHVMKIWIELKLTFRFSNCFWTISLSQLWCCTRSINNNYDSLCTNNAENSPSSTKSCDPGFMPTFIVEMQYLIAFKQTTYQSLLVWPTVLKCTRDLWYKSMVLIFFQWRQSCNAGEIHQYIVGVKVGIVH